MRWIAHDEHGRIRRGKGEPPEGDLFFVDEKGSAALVGGRLYIDGRLAPPGLHRLDLGEAVLSVEVTEAKGKRVAKRLAAERKEGRGRAT